MSKLKPFLFFYVTIITLLLFFSCKEENKISSDNITNTILKDSISRDLPDDSYINFNIKKGSLGKIKIGMTIEQAEKYLDKFIKKDAQAYDFGFDGGGNAYIYYTDSKPMLALIPKRETNEILAIAAIGPNYKTEEGLSPKTSVGAIIKKYPSIKVQLNLMMSWEYFTDKENNFDFVFMTNQDHQIGSYSDLETESEPTRKNSKSDWILIK